MRLFYQCLFPALWIVYLVYWNLMALRVKVAQRMEPLASRVLRVAAFVAGAVLFSFPQPLGWLNLQLWPQGLALFWAGFAITLAGLLFCVWARVHLGRNWSRSVTIKQNHELIVSGPYALVRHPIYTGLLTGLIGTVLALGQLRGVAAFVLMAAPIWFKLRLEEKWMRAQFGPVYEGYAGRVKALVPFVL